MNMHSLSKSSPGRPTPRFEASPFDEDSHLKDVESSASDDHANPEHHSPLSSKFVDFIKSHHQMKGIEQGFLFVLKRSAEEVLDQTESACRTMQDGECKQEEERAKESEAPLRMLSKIQEILSDETLIQKIDQEGLKEVGEEFSHRIKLIEELLRQENRNIEKKHDKIFEINQQKHEVELHIKEIQQELEIESAQQQDTFCDNFIEQEEHMENEAEVQRHRQQRVRKLKERKRELLEMRDREAAEEEKQNLAVHDAKLKLLEEVKILQSRKEAAVKESWKLAEHCQKKKKETEKMVQDARQMGDVLHGIQLQVEALRRPEQAEQPEQEQPKQAQQSVKGGTALQPPNFSPGSKAKAIALGWLVVNLIFSGIVGLTLTDP